MITFLTMTDEERAAVRDALDGAEQAAIRDVLEWAQRTCDKVGYHPATDDGRFNGPGNHLRSALDRLKAARGEKVEGQREMVL